MTTVFLVGNLLLALVGCAPEAAPDESALFEERLEAILLEPDTLVRARAFPLFLDGLGPTDAARVRSVFGRMWQQVGVMETLLFASWWAQADPKEALERLSEGAFGDNAELAFSEVIRTWTRNDHEAVRAYLVEVGSRFPPDLTLMALVRGWAESGDAGLWVFLEELGKGVQRQKAIEIAVDHMVLTQGVEATVAFLETLPEDGAARFKLQVARRVAAALVLRDPEFAAAWAEKVHDTPTGDTVLEFVVGRWAQLDAEAAMVWVGGLDPSPEQVKAVELAYNMWSRRDLVRALEWVGEQPPLESLEPARSLYAALVVKHDLEAGVAVLDTIKDPTRLSWATLQVGRAFVEADRSAALAWLDTRELSPKLREAILDPDPMNREKRREKARLRQAAKKAAAASDAVEGLPDVGNEVGGVLDSDGVADQ